MIYKFTVRNADADNPAVQDLRQRLRLPDLTVSRDYYIESTSPLAEEKLAEIAEALGGSFANTVESVRELEAGREVQVSYKRGIVDNENDSLVTLCGLLGVTAKAGKMAVTYRSADSRLEEVIREHCWNPHIEALHTAEPRYETLLPSGEYSPMETFDLRGMSDDELETFGLSGGRNLNLRQMKQVRRIQTETNAEYVTDVLLEAVDARWSDHCSHTTWKSLGNLLGDLVEAARATKNPNIVSMFHDNAGVWDFYDGYCIALKAETHNGPSAISAYFGQLTKLGGVLRDILGTGLGADPIGVYEYTATGPLDSPSPIQGRPSPRQIAIETIRAIKEYGNTFGVPMMWSRLTQHPKYRGKPFALGGCLGLIPNKFAERGKPRPGDHVMLIGGLTGNDGIHGASASSAGGDMDTAAVQIGSPLEQVKFRQAIIDLRDADCLRAITDVGGAGLNSAVGEMGEACGVWLNTALVPLKTSGLPMWRILLSESQERMVMAIIPEKLTEARDTLERHFVRNTVVGRFTGTKAYCVVHDTTMSEGDVVGHDPAALPLTAEVGLNVPYELLEDEPESIGVEWEQPLIESVSMEPMAAEQLREGLPQLVSDTEFADQIFADRQYDSSVQGDMFYGPHYGEHARIPTSYTAITPVSGKPFACVLTAAFNPWLFDANPVAAARQCFLATLTAQVLAGVKLEDVCLCDNFYTPDREHRAFPSLVGMVKELAELVKLFGTPLISGKDSSAGTTDTDDGQVSVPPAVFLSALGKVPDKAQLLPNEWQTPGNSLVLIGPRCESLAGTAVSRVLGVEANDVDDLSATDHLQFLKALQDVPAGVIKSGVTLGTLGVIGRVFENTIAGNYGAALSPQGDAGEFLREDRCGALIEVEAQSLADLPVELSPQVVGQVTDSPQSILVDGVEVLTEEAISNWLTTFEKSLR